MTGPNTANLTLAEIRTHLDDLLEKAKVATEAPVPPWVLTLLIAVARYEDEHGVPGDRWGCLADALNQVPIEIRQYADRVVHHRADGGTQA